MNKPTSDVLKSSATGLEMNAGILPADVLSNVFLFADLKEIPRISRVSQEWQATLKDAEQAVWESIMEKHYPRLAKIIQMVPPAKADGTTVFSWKEAFKICVTSSPPGLNKDLQKDFETVFRPRGIVAFSNCCHYNCSGSYNEDPTFNGRKDDGIYFIRFCLNGMNYEPDKYEMLVGMGRMGGIPASYGSLEYLNKNWDAECLLLDQWCAVLGLEKGDYVIHKPESENRCVMIELKKPVTLEGFQYEEEEDISEDESYGDY